ncbi:MAG: cytochrome c [Planctomycetes bacterium]|nr:cytochrome c [Planctomycetota bacterium]
MNAKLSIIAGILGGLAAAFGIVSLLARDYRVRNREIFTEMQYSVAAESQAEHPVLPGGIVEQPPAEGSHYRGQKPYVFSKVALEKLSADELALVKAQINPAAGVDGDRRVWLLDRGKAVFAASCASCHGQTGTGGAPVSTFGIGATNLQVGVAKYTDGELYHIITSGVRSMPAHEGHVRPDDRWATILFLRQLQGGNKP